MRLLAAVLLCAQVLFSGLVGLRAEGHAQPSQHGESHGRLHVHLPFLCDHEHLERQVHHHDAKPCQKALLPGEGARIVDPTHEHECDAFYLAGDPFAAGTLREYGAPSLDMRGLIVPSLGVDLSDVVLLQAIVFATSAEPRFSVARLPHVLRI